MPSSPNVPCRTGNTTSMSGCAPGSGRIGPGLHLPSLSMMIVDHFVLRRIQRRDDGFGRAKRDLVLAAAPAVDQTATRVFISQSQNLLSHRRHDQFDGQIRGAVHFVDHRIHFHHFHRDHVAAIADHLHGEVRFAIGDAAAHRRADAGRIFGIDEIHIEREMEAGGVARGDDDAPSP